MQNIETLSTGQQLKTYRQIKGLTQQDTANYLGCTAATYANKENGNREFNRAEMIALKKLFRLNAEQFYNLFFKSYEKGDN